MTELVLIMLLFTKCLSMTLSQFSHCSSSVGLWPLQCGSIWTLEGNDTTQHIKTMRRLKKTKQKEDRSSESIVDLLDLDLVLEEVCLELYWHFTATK